MILNIVILCLVLICCLGQIIIQWLGVNKGEPGRPGALIVFINEPGTKLHFCGKTDQLPTSDMKEGDVYIMDNCVWFWHNNTWECQRLFDKYIYHDGV